MGFAAVFPVAPGRIPGSRFAQAVERAGRLVTSARSGLGARFGVPVPAWRILAAVSGSPDPLSVSELARRLRQTR